MSAADLAPDSLSDEQRLALIDRLWISIAKDAQLGDFRASAALDRNRQLEAELVAELHRRVEAFRRAPSAGIPWERLKMELKQKFG